MKKIFSTLAVAAALFAGYSAYNTKNETRLTDVALANVEALANYIDKLDCQYVRDDKGICTINVGTKGKIKLFNGTILSADAEGNISFDGKVICSSGGSSACRPIECIDLYEVVLK